jgi:hypothetical protein
LGFDSGHGMRTKWFSSREPLVLLVPKFHLAFPNFPTKPYLLVEPFRREVEESFVNTLDDYSQLFDLLYGFVKLSDSNI